MQESFVFYGSFFEAIECLGDPEEQLLLFKAISSYALTGEELELPASARAAFCVIKPVVDANNQRRKNGKKGGRPIPKPVVTEDNNHKTQKEKPNENENENENGNENENVTVTEKPSEKPAERSLTAKAVGCVKTPELGEITFSYEEDQKLHGVNAAQLDYWRKQFPLLNIEQELRNAESWLACNRGRRKTDIRNFLTNWLIRSHDRFGGSGEKYSKLDGNIPETVTEEERKAFNGF